jgi:hypothetical protein
MFQDEFGDPQLTAAGLHHRPRAGPTPSANLELAAITNLNTAERSPMEILI